MLLNDVLNPLGKLSHLYNEEIRIQLIQFSLNWYFVDLKIGTKQYS